MDKRDLLADTLHTMGRTDSKSDAENAQDIALDLAVLISEMQSSEELTQFGRFS